MTLKTPIELLSLLESIHPQSLSLSLEENELQRLNDCISQLEEYRDNSIILNRVESLSSLLCTLQNTWDSPEMGALPVALYVSLNEADVSWETEYIELYFMDTEQRLLTLGHYGKYPTFKTLIANIHSECSALFVQQQLLSDRESVQFPIQASTLDLLQVLQPTLIPHYEQRLLQAATSDPNLSKIKTRF